MTIEAFWQKFLESTNKDSSTKYIECFYFARTEEVANELLALVLSGKKTATTSSLLAYEVDDSTLPQVGDYSIVTDWDGNPRCVIETTAVITLAFNEMTYDICKREGEDDTLESWQNNHRPLLIKEADELGYVFSENMPIVFEDFKVVFTV